MVSHLKIFLIVCLAISVSDGLFAQAQSCPYSISFPTGDLTHWEAYTGNNKGGNGPSAILQVYDSTTQSPAGTIGAITVDEYALSSSGIQVNTTNSEDPFGNFDIIPTINGFYYGHSIKLGSTSITTGGGSSGPKGGYVRGVSYAIHVPAGSSAVPYTMTYAYAMVLENGSHNSNEQPLLQANLNTENGNNISCASYSYFLPTFNNAGSTGGGATLDVDAAIRQGFSLSSELSPNENGNQGETKHRVWTKGWTEVTFDLSPFRGQTVYFTFEADNCVPGGHFAYAYIALKNSCGGLSISGTQVACTNSVTTYSVPTLANATYSWTVPAGWQILNSSDTTNILLVKAGANGGTITAHEKNSCADLSASVAVTTTVPTIAGTVAGNNTVCSGINSSILSLSGNRGNVVKWIYSTDGNIWSDAGNVTSKNFNAVNLTKSTFYKAIVQNGNSCAADSSGMATILVDAKSVAGIISPESIEVCLNQNKGAHFILNNSSGKVVDWQSSPDGLIWSNITPVVTDTIFNVMATAVVRYRAIVKSGVCPADTSNIVNLTLNNTPFPKAIISPVDTTICFGTDLKLRTTILIGTEFEWLSSEGLQDVNGGAGLSTPYSFTAQASPVTTTNYIIKIKNGDCPNSLIDTFTVHVLPSVSLNAGGDTSVVVGQPLQLIASTTNTDTLDYVWSPSANLDDPYIYDPVATLNSTIESIMYKVRATNSIGCFSEDSIKVKVFKTKPDIFVPTAFTPNGDGKNDILKSIPVGISVFEYFRIFNRYGQLIFSTGNAERGWDGTFKGSPQQSGTFVYMAEGVDYKGNVITRKGTVVLIR